jgi:hypothetical protein
MLCACREFRVCVWGGGGGHVRCVHAPFDLPLLPNANKKN